MARPRERKRHVQQDWLNQDGTKKVRKRNKGARPVGRPRKAGAGAPHTIREAFKPSEPLHIVLRVEEVMRNLRKRNMYRALRAATLAVASREDFRIVHVSIQRLHVHLLVEADGKRALSRGLQAFEISAAKHLNAALKWKKRRRGKVFTDRYHSEVIRSRRQARHALAYVLNNWRKHREDQGRNWNVDPFSTGCSFTGWKAFEERLLMWNVPATYEPMFVWLPKTWLLREGWMLYGRIDFHEVPSSAAKRANQPKRSLRALPQLTDA
ncbi:MAG: transposase [Deltaproteobacteria bacterium]|nr:transposase [Deltaproteobacteria bacterium]